MIKIRLNPIQREELRRRTHEKGMAPQTRDRLEMIRLSDAGWSIPQIARHLGCHEQTVRKYVKAFLADGFDALPDRPRPGRPSKVKPEHLDAMERMLDESTRTWTTPQLVGWLRQEYGVSICPDHLSRLLHKRRFRWKRTKNSLKHKQSNPALQAAKKAELEELKKSGSARSH